MRVCVCDREREKECEVGMWGIGTGGTWNVSSLLFSFYVKMSVSTSSPQHTHFWWMQSSVVIFSPLSPGWSSWEYYDSKVYWAVTCHTIISLLFMTLPSEPQHHRLLLKMLASKGTSTKEEKPPNDCISTSPCSSPSSASSRRPRRLLDLVLGCCGPS